MTREKNLSSGRARGVALAVLAVAAPLVVVSSFSAHRASQWLFVVATLLVPAAVAALGAARGGRLGRWSAAFVLFGALLLSSGVVVVLLSRAGGGDSDPEGALLPLLLAFAGLWLAPFLLTSWLHAASFRELGVGAEEIERLRRLARESKGGSEPG